LFGISEAGWEFESARVADADQEAVTIAAASRRQALIDLVRPPVEEPATGLTGERVKDFIHRYFRPENAILTVVGTVRREVVLPRVGREMEDVKLSPLEPAERAARGSEPKAGFRYREVRTSVAQPSILVGFPAPGDESDEHLALLLVRYMMTEGYASLMGIPRQGEEGRILITRSGFRSSRAGSALWFEIEPGKATLESAETRFFALLRALSDDIAPGAVLDRGKSLMLTDWYTSQETLSGRAVKYAQSEIEGDFTARDRYPERLKAISAGQVREAVRRYLGIERAGVVEYLPEGFEARTFTASGLLETLKTLVAARYPEEKALLVSLGADPESGRFQIPAFNPTHTEESLRKSSVLRGPEIYLRERHFLPLVHFGFFYVGGRISETPDNAGLTEVLVRAMLEYRLRTSPLEMFAAETYGARFGTSNEEEFFGLRLTVTSNNLDPVFSRIVEWLRTAADFSESDIESARRSYSMDLEEQCGEGCRNRLEGMQELFPGHPYGYGALALSRPLRSIQPGELVEWRDRHSVKILPVFVVSGDVSGTSFLQGLVSRLSDPGFSQGKLPDIKAKYAEKQPVTRKWRNRTLLLYEGPKGGSDYVEMLDATSLLMEGRPGRVQQRLRDQKLGFRFLMSQDTFTAGGVLELEVRALAGHEDEAVTAALQQIRSSRENTVPPSQLRGTLVKTILRLLVRQQNPETFLPDTMKAVLYGEPADYANRYRLNIRQMRMGELELAIDRYLGEDE
jgi:predicted Zn-dependent peptidase